MLLPNFAGSTQAAGVLGARVPRELCTVAPMCQVVRGMCTRHGRSNSIVCFAIVRFRQSQLPCALDCLFGLIVVAMEGVGNLRSSLLADIGDKDVLQCPFLAAVMEGSAASVAADLKVRDVKAGRVNVVVRAGGRLGFTIRVDPVECSDEGVDGSASGALADAQRRDKEAARDVKDAIDAWRCSAAKYMTFARDAAAGFDDIMRRKEELERGSTVGKRKRNPFGDEGTPGKKARHE